MALHPQMNHDDPNAARLRTKQTGSLRWQFTQAGELRVCLSDPRPQGSRDERNHRGAMSCSDNDERQHRARAGRRRCRRPRATDVITGGCQCGAVRYALLSEPTGASICHCRMCQKAFGNYFAPLTGVPNADLVWTRGAPGVFKSSEAVERGFCRDCGTPLTFRYVARDRISVSIGSLDEPAPRDAGNELGRRGRASGFPNSPHVARGPDGRRRDAGGTPSLEVAPAS